MNSAITKVLIVGGGTAGWLAACRIAAARGQASGQPLDVTLIESPDIPTVGVGEGTWPTLRRTLERIGIAESDFLIGCDAAFKQGSRFDGWKTGDAGDTYYHPFVPPPAAAPRDLVDAWSSGYPDLPFAQAVCAQLKVCALNLAPRQRTMPDYAGALNYAYHLDAGKLAALLAARAVGKLGVRHIRDNVTGVDMAEGGDIAAVRTANSGRIEADLFVDCTGHSALLIGGQYQVPFVDRSGQLFNDRALAVQVPVGAGSAIASQTISTGHSAGWIWDIGLPERRGVGCVYSSAHMSDEAAAETLEAYLRRTAPDVERADLSIRRLTFRSGHRERLWHRNCLALGLSAGFLEPLEASAIVLIELSLDALLDNFPSDRASVDVQAKRLNRLFAYRWDRIVDFLKLHYAVSSRTEPYWLDNRRAATLPDSLSDLLQIWRDQPPSSYDFPEVEEVFPAASYQYVLYGMGFPPPAPRQDDASLAEMIAKLRQVQERSRALAAALPTNRASLDALRSAPAAPAEARLS